jgi:CheY-like chemotaxis protein
MSRKKRIVFVDDDAFFREIFKKRLKDAGFDILMLPYYDGNFIDKIAEFATDLIVLDIIMPTMNGDQIALLLKQDERTKNIPIVFLDNLSEETVGDLAKKIQEHRISRQS